MDITKSREEFEIACRNGLINYGLAKFENGEYASESTRSMFMVFKAGRESIEVDIDWPEANDDFWKEGEDGAYATGHTDGRQQTTDAVVKALRTAGIRIKGESE
ncbi:hypothetical protein ACQ24W_004308 [Yersinia enterocolitica]